jgi:membrane protease YdiL (CAAX protease family)
MLSPRESMTSRWIAIEVASHIPDPDVAIALAQIYGDTPPEALDPPGDADLIAILARYGLEDWLLDRPTIRLLEARGEAEGAASIAQEIEERRARWQRNSELLTAANLLLVGAGVVCALALGLCAMRKRSAPRPPGAVAPWTLATGIGVLVRADFWSRLYFVALGSLGSEFPEALWITPFYTWGTILASLPLVWLIYRHLVGPAQGDLRSCFGFGAIRLSLRELCAITLAALAIDLLGVYLLGTGASALGFDGHWAEGFDETLVWGSTWEVIELSIDYLLWTPIFEELVFRGLLYYSLRRKLDPWSAGIISAGVFSAVHFYSLPGFLATFWSGLVWALAFERARSLLPGIVAHATYNFLYVAGIVGLYR